MACVHEPEAYAATELNALPRIERARMPSRPYEDCACWKHVSLANHLSLGAWRWSLLKGEVCAGPVAPEDTWAEMKDSTESIQVCPSS